MARLYIWALLFVWFFWLFLSSTTFMDCVQDQQGSRPYQQLNEKISFVFSAIFWGKTVSICAIRAANRFQGAIVGASGIAVALFTFTLWQTTKLLASEGKRDFEVTQRAFVFLDSFDYELTVYTDRADAVASELWKIRAAYQGREHLFITRFAVQPKWKNSGSTPTKHMVIQTDWRGPPGPVPPEYAYNGEPVPFFVAPYATERSEIFEMPGVGSLVEHGLGTVVGKDATITWGEEPLFLIWGRADYDDVFGRRLFVQLCYRLRLDAHDGKKLRATFIQWGDYNRTDEFY
ncbi:MAG TPA: hypothetical protein VGC39_10990 [Candidatus Methylacidiphilales bacterium]